MAMSAMYFSVTGIGTGKISMFGLGSQQLISREIFENVAMWVG